MDVTDAPVSGDAVIKALVAGPMWAGTDLSFSFPGTAAQFTGYAAGTEPFNNFAAFSPNQKAAVRTILGEISSFTDLTFHEATGTDVSGAVMRFGMSDEPDTAWGYYPDPDPVGGDAWFNRSTGWYAGPVLGNYAWQGIMHEIGHTLGLDHPHEADPPMDLAHDWMAYTVMSYRSYQGAPVDADSGYTNGDWGYAQSFMMEDIAALQFLYGANYDYRSGDTTYTWSPTTGEEFVNGAGQGAPGGNTVFMTVWDGGGNDTFDFSNYSAGSLGATIDLRPGSYSMFGLGRQLADLGGGVPPGNVATALLYRGDERSLIESAIGTTGNDTVYGNQAANHLVGNAGDDIIYGYDGNDVLDGGDGVNQLWGGDGNDTLNGGSAGDSLVGDGGNDNIHGNGGNDFINGADGNDTLTGGDDNDSVGGGNGDDTISGEAGDDYLSGEVGSDTIEGGDGNDILYGGDGTDTLVGGAGDDTLDMADDAYGIWAGAGDDTLIGGPGDDTYGLDSPNDKIIELDGEGTDTVQVTFDYILPATIENGTIVGPSYNNVHLTGNELDNVLLGYYSDDVLDGGAGADIMRGNWGDDTYFVDNPGDQVYDDGPSVGTDTVYSSVSFTLADTDPFYNPSSGRPATDAQNHIEVLILTGSDNLNATGNKYDNQLVGNSGANVLDGAAGNDTLQGNAADDTLYGRDGNDVLDGGDGADTMEGGAGNDTYYADTWQDTVAESPDGGIDTVHAASSFHLGANVENLILDGSAALNGTGNSAANVLTGNAGANLLTGAAGNDTLTSAAGNDMLNGGLGDDALLGGSGVDTATYALLGGGVSVSLAVTGAQDTGAGGIDTLSAIEKLVGTHFADSLTGNARNNTLDGGGGADTLTGGAGNDTYWVNLKGDVVIEQVDGGTDAVHASAGYTLSANVENLVLEGVGNISGTGNGLANHLTGNVGNNVLNGAAGADTMTGGLGNDIYHVDNAGDAIVEKSGGGSDSVIASIGFTLGRALENLTLAGSAAIDGAGNGLGNALTGNAGANHLGGLNGGDTLSGRGGNDTLDGGSGNDMLIGGSGADLLTGGFGADSFVFALARDSTKAHRDTIEDFRHGQHDLIDLSGIDAIAGGTDDAFTLVAAFDGHAGELVIEAGAAGTYTMLGDTDGDGFGNFAIEVHAATALGAGDFLL